MITALICEQKQAYLVIATGDFMVCIAFNPGGACALHANVEVAHLKVTVVGHFRSPNNSSNAFT